jgi:hypothetical protein
MFSHRIHERKHVVTCDFVLWAVTGSNRRPLRCQRGVAIVTGAAEDDIFLVAADAGAEEVRASEETIEVVTPPGAMKAVEAALTGGRFSSRVGRADQGA